MKFKVFIIISCIFSASANVPIHKTRLISSRIIGGRDAAEGQAPYQCSMQRKASGHYCGCAIISAEWIVTAGHCLKNRSPSLIKILVGTNDRWNSGGKFYNAEKFIVHEDYGKPFYAHDIGLIHLQKPIEFTEKVRPIKFSAKKVGAHENLQITGWGRVKNGKMPRNLQVLNVTSISNEECRKKQPNVVHDSHLCTLAQRGQGICTGDSGSPLVTVTKLGNELVGIVNWSFLCARGSPNGFARISYLYEWIEKNINSQ